MNKHLWVIEYEDLMNKNVDIGIMNFSGSILLNKKGEKIPNYKILKWGVQGTKCAAKEFPGTIMLYDGKFSYSIPSQNLYR